MGKLFNILSNNPQIFVFIVIIGFSVFGTVARKLKEQAAIRKITQDRQRQRTERLRTGRGDAPSEGAAQQETARKQRLAQIAEQRKAQLQELQRRRQRARQQQAGQTAQVIAAPPTSGQPQIKQAPIRPGMALPKSRTPVPPQAPARSPAPKQPQSGVVPVQRQPRRSRRRPRVVQDQPQPQPQPKQEKRVILGERAIIREQAETKRDAAIAAKIHRGEPVFWLQDHKLTHGDLRRAIVLSEILAPPVSMR